MQVLLLPFLILAVAILVLMGVVGLAVGRRRRPGAGRPPGHPEQPPRPGEAPAGGGVAVEEAPPGGGVAVEEAPPAPEVPVVPGAVEAPPRPHLRDRLGKTRALLSGYVTGVLARSDVTGATWDELEEALIRADVGVAQSTLIIENLRTRAKAERVISPDMLLQALKADLKETLARPGRALHVEPGVTNVWLLVGVNGVGKTTTIGKLANRQVEQGRSVILAAGDTFRAAAAEQLQTWSERAGVGLVQGPPGQDPASVIFDAVQKAAAKGVDLVLADTAGRLHTKSNLMEELKKVRRVAERDPGKVTEVLLVVDATTGQNALVQAREFAEAVGVTGVVLTKLDGTAKGGIALAIERELGIPIKQVGIGEGIEDLVDFDGDEFVDALFE
ncbi:MAG: signal recognition particle-docking protein FtsY [Acidimicrobiales bacterium]